MRSLTAHTRPRHVPASCEMLLLRLQHCLTMPEVQEPADGPRPLYVVMACMRDIRKRSDRTDNCFNPLRDTVSTHTRRNL